MKRAQKVKLSLFREDPDNVSVATDEEIQRLAGKLKRVPLGLTAMRIAYVTAAPGGGRMVISGNKRLRCLKAAYGEDGEVPAEWFQDITAMSEAERHEFRINANISDGSFDAEKLLAQYDRGELAELMSADALQEILDAAESDEPKDGKTDADAVPSAPETPVSKRGEVYVCGEHRLMCGDSTDADAVAKLMNGERADLVFTDPPYGMNLDTDYSSMQNHLDFAKEKGFTGGKKYDAGHVDDFHPEMVQAALDLGAKETFLWGADYYAELLPNRNDGSWIVWDKRSNNTDDIEADESSDRMYGSCFELCWSKTKHKRDIARIKWAGVFGTEQEFDHKRHHPTQKPVKLSGRFVNRYSKEGDIVVDIFGGSGSTMIACEQLGRKCRMMELDPHYCDVIRKR